MTESPAERTAIEIVDKFMATQFDEEGHAVVWLVERITTALEQAEKVGMEAAMLSLRRDQSRR